MEYIVYPIEFHHIFDEEPLSTEEYLKGLDKVDLILMTLHLIGIDNKDSYSLEYTNFLKMFFQDFPDSKHLQDIDKRIKKLKQTSNLQNNPDIIFTLIEPRAALLFLKDIILLPTGKKGVKTENDHINFLKAYLSQVEQVQKYKNNLLKSIPEFENPLSKDARIRFAGDLLQMGLSDYNFYDILMTQQMKVLMLDDFIKEKPQLSNIIKLFYASKNIESIFDHLLNLRIVRVYEENKFKEGQISLYKRDYVNHDNLFNRISTYFDSICIDINNPSEAEKKLEDLNDFTCYKQYPVLKLNNDHYSIISRYFFTLNIYDGLFISLLQISQKAGEKDIQRLIKSEFSEEYMFYKVMNRLLFNAKNINISGRAFYDLNDNGRPDYYVRNKKRALLFEYKDILMNKSTRNSQSFSDIENFFKTRLNETKGIPQIIKNIKDILLQDFKLDKGYNEKNIEIYPFLITQDRLYSIHGTNYILNDFFQQRIDNDNFLALKKSHIRPLTVIDIDFLLILSLELKHNLKRFLDLIHSYHIYCSNKDRFISFRNYILNSKKITLNRIDEKDLIRHYFNR